MLLSHGDERMNVDVVSGWVDWWDDGDVVTHTIQGTDEDTISDGSSLLVGSSHLASGS